MNPHVRDLEPFERDWLAEAASQVQQLRGARSGCPPTRLLMAEAADVLPEDLHAAVSTHASGCAGCRMLLADLHELPPAAGASPEEARRILRRVRRESAAGGRALGAGGRWFAWRPALALLTLVACTTAVAWKYSSVDVQAPPVNAPHRAATAAPLPVHPESVFRLDKPAVRMSLAMLTWRSEGGDRKFVADVAPALEAFRQDHYREAADMFARLARSYPRSVEAPYYLGVSLLLTGDPEGAAAALDTAAALGDDGTFEHDIPWYQALAYTRSGQADNALQRFIGLCGESNPYRDRACAAVAAMGATGRPR